MRGPYCHLSGQSEAQIGVIKLGAEWSWLVTGLPSDYGPEQIDIVSPGTGAECDQSRGQESHVPQFMQESGLGKNSLLFNF